MVIFIPVNSYHLRGSMGKYKQQKTLMLHDHSMCLSSIQHKSIRGTLLSNFICITNTFDHCIIKSSVEYSRFVKNTLSEMRNSLFCGSIWLQGKSQLSFTHDVKIVAPENHNIHLNMLYFNFFISYYTPCRQHGMVVSYSGFISENYCGTRLPWDFLTEGNRILLHLVVKQFKQYSLVLDYCSFHTNWVSEVLQVLKTHYDGSHSFDVVKPITFFEMKINSYQLHVTTHQEHYLKLHVTFNNWSILYISVHDGPGRLSQTVFNAKDSKIISGRMIKTTAFLAFIHIRFSDSYSNSSGQIEFTKIPGTHATKQCLNYQKGLIVASSNELENTICMDALEMRHLQIVIYFKMFSFSGPNIVTNLTHSVCQYGGLIIQFDGRKEQYEFCEPLNDYKVYTKNKAITIIIVWFAGYSSGELVAALWKSTCRVLYSEFILSRATLVLPTILHRVTEPTDGCEIFVCPALVNNYQHQWVLQFGPPSFGTTHIELVEMQTLSACDPNYSVNNYSDDNNVKRMIHFESVAYDEWPFSLPPDISHLRFNYSHNVRMSFDYLQTATISLPYICIPGFSRIQKVVVVKTSSCAASTFDAVQKYLIINGIPSLHGNCLSKIYIFTPTIEGPIRYVSFIFKDNGFIQKGYEINVVYHACLTECRQYRYSTLVKGVDENSVLEYTANVGQPTYIDNHHRGFKIIIITPNSLCSQHLKCELQVNIFPETFTTEQDTGNEDTSNSSLLTFFKTR